MVPKSGVDCDFLPGEFVGVPYESNLDPYITLCLHDKFNWSDTFGVDVKPTVGIVISVIRKMYSMTYNGEGNKHNIVFVLTPTAIGWDYARTFESIT